MYPEGPAAKQNFELKKIERSIRNQKNWVQGALSELGSVIKIKKDVEYYMGLVVRLEKRVECLERKQK